MAAARAGAPRAGEATEAEEAAMTREFQMLMEEARMPRLRELAERYGVEEARRVGISRAELCVILLEKITSVAKGSVDEIVAMNKCAPMVQMQYWEETKGTHPAFLRAVRTPEGEERLHAASRFVAEFRREKKPRHTAETDPGTEAEIVTFALRARKPRLDRRSTVAERIEARAVPAPTPTHSLSGMSDAERRRLTGAYGASATERLARVRAQVRESDAERRESDARGRRHRVRVDDVADELRRMKMD